MSSLNPLQPVFLTFDFIACIFISFLGKARVNTVNKFCMPVIHTYYSLIENFEHNVFQESVAQSKIILISKFLIYMFQYKLQ